MLNGELRPSVTIEAREEQWYVVVVEEGKDRRLGPFNIRQANRTANEECRRLGLPPEWPE